MSVITTYESVDQATQNRVASILSPLANNVALIAQKETNKSPGGIVIPDSASKEGSSKGVIVAVGPGKVDANGKQIAMCVKTGQVAYYSKYAGTEVSIDGTKVLIIKADDLLAIENN